MSLSKAIENDLPQNMYLPDELKKLFKWIEDHDYCIENNRIIGFLKNPKKDHYLEDDEGNDIVLNGTEITFSPQDDLDKEYHTKAYNEKSDRIYTFARTGGDGSTAAFWINDKGEQKIVHIGSGSGSTLFCILSHNIIDFIRLIAIGYEEICWLESEDDILSLPSTEEQIVLPNIEFQEWVKSTFNVSIPQTASEIFQKPSLMDDEISQDEFWNWDRKNSSFW